ncbi:MAG TPA: metallophosphoesterase [Kofleriaceae bacterium]|nr:metallophosphoesterase [Kofleriaceae bacterium]
MAEAAPSGAPPSVRGTQLVSAGNAWRWQVVRAPQLAPQIGRLAISGLDVAAGRAAEPISVFGDGVAPARWPFAIDDDARAIASASRDERIAVAFGITTFSLASADEGLAMLELRVRYEDGLVAWLNGVEVARRSLPPGTSATAIAKRPHGPEWETFYIPVSPGLLRAGDNLLALEVRPSGRRDAPTAAVDLVGRRDRGIVRGPVLAEVGATAARILVDTDPDTEAVVRWGTGAVLDQELRSPPGHHHVFALTSLPARGAIRYRVHAGATQTPVYTFRVPPAAGSVIRIGIYGDVRGGHGVHKQLVDSMLAEPLDLIGVTGDMVRHGSDEADWQRFFAITAPLLAQVPYLPAIGNHDLGWDGAGAARDAQEVFALPPGPAGRPPGAYWYSVDLADIHLVFLDSNAYERVSQDLWLEADLAAARSRKVRAILVLTHDGPYSRGTHRGNREARTRLVPILMRHRVDYVFSGHDHIYQRGEVGGLRYIVTGGGGAPLYGASCGERGKPACAVEDGLKKLAREHHYLVLTIDKTTLEVCTRRPDGRLLEKCTRSKLAR